MQIISGRANAWSQDCDSKPIFLTIIMENSSGWQVEAAMGIFNNLVAATRFPKF
jgi:hypothetical protein